MNEKRDKTNKKFMLLSAIGIFMVVDHHTFTCFNILADFLPYNSFFMPMFVFISGYFNKVNGSTNLWTYFVKKVKTLLIPYLGLSLTVFAIQQLINYIKLGNEMTVLPSGYLTFVLNRIITIGSFGTIAEPMWFVIALFSSLMIYAVLKKFLYKIWNNYIMFVLFVGLQILVVYLAKTADMEALEYLLVPFKCLFFFPFIELGIIYRDHLEKKHTAMSGGSKIILMFILLVINAIRTTYMPMAYDIAVDSINDLTGFTSPFYVTPLVSAVVGILFWLTFADLAGKQVYESRFVNFMSCNTFWIMGLHIIFYNILNVVLMGINNLVELPYFDVEAFKGSEWYFWGISNSIKILYVLVGVLGPLGLKWIYDKICALVNCKIEKAGADQKVKTLKLISKAAFVIISVLAVWLIVILTQPKPDDLEPYYSELIYDTAEEQGYADQPGDTDYDEQAISPVYAYLDLAYENNGTDSDYLTDPIAINGNGTYNVTINRNDNDEAILAFNGLSYMGIRLIDDENADIDISNVIITDLQVKCDGVLLKLDGNGSTPYEDGIIYDFFDCYAPDGNATEVYDFKDKNVIEISFTISGAEFNN